MRSMEKITGYTPGSWRVLTEGDGYDEMTMRTILSCENKPRNLSEIALVTTGSYPDEVEEANAQLIALAPTLYEQYFKMLEVLKKSLIQLEHDDVYRGLQEDIRQTIKEAEGLA